MKSISVAAAQAFDRLAQERYGIPSLLLMENAGRSAAEEALKMLGGGKRVAVVSGVGNNGGDGFVAARHLLNAGQTVQLVIVGDQAKLKADAKTNREICGKMAGALLAAELPDECDLIIDAIFGLGLNAPVAGQARAMIERINRSGKPVLALDVPSGLDADTGAVRGVAVKANRTVTFAAVKNGMLRGAGPRLCGQIIVRDIGLAYNGELE